MITLEEIRKFAIEHEACNEQLDPFIECIELNDELLAWQTVLGNLSWLGTYGLHLNTYAAMEKANYIGKTWNIEGRLATKEIYPTTGNITIFKEFFDDGYSLHKETYVDNKHRIVGLDREWNRDGELVKEVLYNEDGSEIHFKRFNK